MSFIRTILCVVFLGSIIPACAMKDEWEEVIGGAQPQVTMHAGSIHDLEASLHEACSSSLDSLPVESSPAREMDEEWEVTLTPEEFLEQCEQIFAENPTLSAYMSASGRLLR